MLSFFFVGEAFNFTGGEFSWTLYLGLQINKRKELKKWRNSDSYTKKKISKD